MVRFSAPLCLTFAAMNALAAIYTALGATPASAAECINVDERMLTFEGTLNYHIFPGPPNYEDVRKGDSPEPAYLVTLDRPICVTGDEFVDPAETFDQIQIWPEYDNTRAITESIQSDLRRLVGKRVVVEGSSAFGRHTAHHRAPLVLPISKIVAASDPARAYERDPTRAYGTPMTTVEAFYLALHFRHAR